MPATTTHALLLSALLSLPIAAVAAQTAPLLVEGRVFREGDRAVALSGVEVSVTGSTVTARTDSAGRFKLTGLGVGAHELSFRLVDYRLRLLTVAEGTPLPLSIGLSAIATELRQIRIDGAIASYPARFEEQYQRASHANGRFFTREQIDSLQPYDTRSLLSLVPTVLINDRGITFQKCQSAFSGVIPAIDPDVIRLQAHRLTGNVQVYIDGVRMTRGDYDADRAVRVIQPSSIQIMEVYSGTARIPGEFLNDACAVIAIWTKRY